MNSSDLEFTHALNVFKLVAAQEVQEMLMHGPEQVSERFGLHG